LTQAPQGSESSAPHLQRVLTLWDLIFYGIIIVMPIAPIPLFGITQQLSRGHFVTTILIAMAAMTFTAASYGRMAALYPAAGSTYTYVGRGLNPHVGFLAGWAMVLDFLVQPLINSIFVALTLKRFVPEVPYFVLAAICVGTMTFMNLQGIRSNARTNLVLLLIMSTVILIFMVLAVRFLFHGSGWGGVFSLNPFYDPKTFNIRSIWTATSYSALTYVGFEGVTTLAEDVVNPKRNVLLAAVWVCIITGILAGLEAYLGQRVWPQYSNFPSTETAFMDIARRVGGPFLFQAFGVILILACMGAGMSGQLAAARLLYGMGRDKVLPQRIFGYLDPRHNTPTRNVLLIGCVAYIGSLVLSYEAGGEIMNFGAFAAYMGVNLATFWQFSIVPPPTHTRRPLQDIVIPLIGFLFCLWIWTGVTQPGMIAGGLWLLGGFIYAAVNTRGFRSRPIMLDFTES
jgi:amino acid transporter